MSTTPRKPEWLRFLLANYEQIEQTVRHHIYHLEQTVADQGVDTPANVCLALNQSRADLEEVLQQQALLEAGWLAINTAP